jgi:hypothetical protein
MTKTLARPDVAELTAAAGELRRLVEKLDAASVPGLILDSLAALATDLDDLAYERESAAVLDGAGVRATTAATTCTWRTRRAGPPSYASSKPSGNGSASKPRAGVRKRAGGSEG